MIQEIRSVPADTTGAAVNVIKRLSFSGLQLPLFVDVKTKAASYNCMRYVTKAKDGYSYIIYAWQENMNLLNSSSERELSKMINVIAPL